MPLGILGCLFTIGALLHNLEEVLYLPTWTSRVKIWHQPVGRREFTFAATVLSALMVLVTALGTRSKPEGLGAYVMAGYVFAMVLNVFLPHVLMTVFSHSYMPGTATALLLNLPLGSLFIFRAIAEHQVKLVAFCWTAPLTVLAMLMLLPVLFSLGRVGNRRSATR